MNLLADLTTLLEGLRIPCDVGAFTSEAPDAYVAIVPIRDHFAIQGDGAPLDELQEARLSLYTKHDYIVLKRQIETALLQADFTITGRQYVAFEPETKYHHYELDVANLYFMEDTI